MAFTYIEEKSTFKPCINYVSKYVVPTIISSLLGYFLQNIENNPIATIFFFIGILSSIIAIVKLISVQFSRWLKMILLTVICSITMILIYGAFSALALPKYSIYGKIQQIDDLTTTTHEINSISFEYLLNNEAGKSSITNEINTFSIDGLSDREHWVFVLNFFQGSLLISEFEMMPTLRTNSRSYSSYRAPTKAIELIPWKTFLFEINKDNLSDDVLKSILDLANEMRNNQKYKNFRLLIHGHGCQRGSGEYNVRLSARRAQNVREALLKYGVAYERLIPICYGNSKLLEGTDDKELYFRNRRVECFLIPPNKGYSRFILRNITQG